MSEPVYKTGYGSVIAERREGVREELARILPADAPRFVWEVGCGHGHFLTAYATAHPDRCCIGVDIESSRIVRATKKRDRARLKNLHFIRSEARLFLEALPAGARLAAVFVLFPDPWPKARHHKHRILQPSFLEQVARWAAPDCRLCFRTDYAPYFAEARETVAASPFWEIVAEPWPFEFETVFQSRAEQHESLIARRRPA